MTATLALGSALPALATDGTAASSSASSKPVVMRVNKANAKKFDAACIKTAVVARETAIGSAWTTFSASMTSAYATRSAALATAWSNTDAAARRTAIKAAWDTFKKSARSARETWRTAQKSARKAFKEAAKKCGVPVGDALHGVEPDEIDVNVQ